MSLDPTQGHEQSGTRPCVVVSDEAINTDLRFPLVAVIPLTSTPGVGALYPRLEPGESGLSKTSFGLVDQVRSVDKRRVRRVYGVVDDGEMHNIDEGLLLFLGLG